MGKSSQKAPRPLKDVLPSNESVKDFFKYFSVDKLSNTLLAAVTASHDRTPHKRKLLQNLQSTLDERIQAGEDVKYVNGILRIVNKTSRNKLPAAKPLFT